MALRSDRISCSSGQAGEDSKILRTSTNGDGEYASVQKCKVPKVFSLDPRSAATSQDRTRWTGFCEIESEPAFFQVMLEDFGVKDVVVQEVFGLEDDLLDMLPKPVYGLVFLFRWREEGKTERISSVAPKIWFANQNVPNACASVALLNVVNNVPDLDLGVELSHFRETTTDLSPDLRGDSIGDFDFLRNIHNSFARKNDMLNEDLKLKNEVAALKDKKHSKKSEQDDDATAAFHFNAFVPVDGQLWKLDGLAPEPIQIGNLGSKDWLTMARPDIAHHMSLYGEQEMGFALIALCKDPIVKDIKDLARNIKTMNLIIESLQNKISRTADLPVQATYEHSIIFDDALLRGPDGSHKLSQGDLDAVELDEQILETLHSSEVVALEAMLEECVASQPTLRQSIRQSLEQRISDRERSNARRWDHAPFIIQWLSKLSEKEVLRDLVEKYSTGTDR